MSELSEKQRRFTRCIGELIDFAYASGYELTFGDCYRTPEQAHANAEAGIGIAKSVHILRLAVDFNLFVAGEYETDSEAYAPLGDYWKTLDKDARWGGDFRPRPDGNHFSFTHGGVS